ncbi:hypothetical protein LAZ67_23001289 [Cordylochernes scorpioides]|uniref:Transposase n=1 Tax=Cordylochernes scorpioides TaxID=51811 RepID=A0ABY6LRM7_9ARAC|nr:hypothetical protein LAZ67_23001289 [Cordylochernes scorpioides]
MKANERLFLILLQVTKLGFTMLIQKQSSNLLFCALQNYLLKKFAELEVLEYKWSLIFLIKYGFIDIVKLEDRKTVSSDWYTTKCHPTVFEKIKQSRPRAQLRGVLLHHDNARPHTSSQTLDFLANSGGQLVNHPPYSPDLAPCAKGEYFEKLKKCKSCSFNKNKTTFENYSACRPYNCKLSNVKNSILKEREMKRPCGLPSVEEGIEGGRNEETMTWSHGLFISLSFKIEFFTFDSLQL